MTDPTPARRWRWEFGRLLSPLGGGWSLYASPEDMTTIVDALNEVETLRAERDKAELRRSAYERELVEAFRKLDEVRERVRVLEDALMFCQPLLGYPTYLEQILGGGTAEAER